MVARYGVALIGLGLIVFQVVSGSPEPGFLMLGSSMLALPYMMASDRVHTVKTQPTFADKHLPEIRLAYAEDRIDAEHLERALDLVFFHHRIPKSLTNEGVDLVIDRQERSQRGSYWRGFGHMVDHLTYIENQPNPDR